MKYSCFDDFTQLLTVGQPYPTFNQMLFIVLDGMISSEFLRRFIPFHTVNICPVLRVRTVCFFSAIITVATHLRH